MIGIGGRIVNRQVAGGALCGGAIVLSIDVALRTGRSGVLPGERKIGFGVIELGTLPLRGGVAGLAVGCESGGFVIRIRGGIVGREMARGAILRGARVPAVDVTLRAGRGGVFAGEREP